VELHVRILEVVEEDLQVVAGVAVLTRILDALAHLAVADVVELRLEQRAGVGDAGHERGGVRVDPAGQVPAHGRVEFLRDGDVGPADEADQGHEREHDQEGEPCRVAPEEVFDARAFGHGRCSDADSRIGVATK
jgi:hypothetical protein